MENLWRKHKVLLLAVLAVASLVFLLIYQHYAAVQRAGDAAKTKALFSGGSTGKATVQPGVSAKAAQPSEEMPSREMVVDIKGAVQKPGIYRMSSSDRISDAVSRAGGLTGKADQDKINLARKLSDEMVVYVPEKGEKGIPDVAGQSGGALSAAAVSVGGTGQGNKVNINTADEQGMQDLPGIGPAKAKAIVTYRNGHGPFKTVDELTNVSGIGEKSLEKIKPSATVN